MTTPNSFDTKQDREHYPLDSRELSYKFASVWEEYGNTSSRMSILLWGYLFTYINESYHRNTLNREKRYMVVPAPTGSGKTQCFRFYAAELTKKEFEDGERPGMMIVSPFIDEINEAVEQINEMAGAEVAAAYHSQSRFKVEQDERELDNYQIVVISHEYYIRNHYLKAVNNDVFQQVSSYQGKPRPIVVIDESIKLINHIGIDRDSINRLKYNLNPLYDNNNSLYEEYKLVCYIHKNFDNLFDKKQTTSLVDLVGDKFKLLSDLSEELNVSVERVKQILKLPKFIEELNNDQIYRLNTAIRRDGKKDILMDAANLRYLLDEDLYQYGSGKNTAYRTSTLELPNHSLVVLDATAYVDKFYQEFPHTKIYTVPPVKTYENVTIRLVDAKSKLGKSTLNKNPDLHWTNIFFHLYELGMNKDNTVVFVHKVLKDAMAEYHHTVDNFGNLVGVNRYKECANTIIYGIPYKPKYVHYDSLHQSAKNRGIAVEDIDTTIEDMEYSSIAAELIQAANRGKCRHIVSGKAPESHITLLLPNNKRLSEVIVKSIESEMNDVSIERKSYPLEFDVKKSKVGKATPGDEAVLACIDSTLDEIKLSDLFRAADVDTSKKVKERITRNLTKPEHYNSYIAVEVSKLGYRMQKNKQKHWILVKHSAG